MSVGSRQCHKNTNNSTTEDLQWFSFNNFGKKKKMKPNNARNTEQKNEQNFCGKIFQLGLKNKLSQPAFFF